MHATSGTDDKARLGDTFPTLELAASTGQLVTIPDPAGDYVHLQLRRFAGCPICNLHLRSIVTRHDEIRSRDPGGRRLPLHRRRIGQARGRTAVPADRRPGTSAVSAARRGPPAGLAAEPARFGAAIAGQAAALGNHSTKRGALGPVRPPEAALGCQQIFWSLLTGRSPRSNTDGTPTTSGPSTNSSITPVPRPPDARTRPGYRPGRVRPAGWPGGGRSGRSTGPYDGNALLHVRPLTG
jgi:hypothetical protein